MRKYIKYSVLTLIILMTKIGLYDAVSAERDSLFSVIAELNGGMTYKLNTYYEDDAHYRRMGFPAGLRLMWKPEHLLGIGLESGYLHLSSYTRNDIATQYGKTKAEATMNAVPMLLVFSMQKWNAELAAGIGVYYLTVNIDAEDINFTQHSYEWDMGFMLSAGYSYPLTDNLSLGANFKFYSIAERKDYLISPQLHLRWRFLEW